jgi:hypothetical protein
LANVVDHIAADAFTGAGYISHLVLDGITPESLPLLGKV